MVQPRSYAEITKRNLPQSEDKIGTNRNFFQKPSTPEIYTNECCVRNIQPLEMAQPRNYAETTMRNLPQTEHTTSILTKFLDEFKNLIQQLLQQNTMVLNMLTTLVKKTKYMAKFLRVTQWNANGLLNHQEEIKIFLNINATDILLISKIHFTSRSYLNI
jgi:hypothetical protein